MTPSPSNPPAGWFLDPENPDLERWWTGESWGPQQRARSLPAPPASPPAPIPPVPVAPISYRTQRADYDEKNGAATASMILVIIAFGLNLTTLFLGSGIAVLINLIAGLLGFVAIILGIIGLVAAVRRLTRKRNAIVGLVLGCILAFWGTGQAVVAVATPSLAEVEKSLSTAVSEELGRSVKLLCTGGAATPVKGEEYECLDVYVTVKVTMIDDQGRLTWTLVEDLFEE